MVEPEGRPHHSSPGYRLIRRWGRLPSWSSIAPTRTAWLRPGERPVSFRAGQAERALIAGVGKPAALVLLLVPAAAIVVDAWLIRGWADANWLSDGAEPVQDPFE